MSKAQLCVFAKRAGIEAAVGYSDAGQTVVGNDCDEVPFVIHGWLGIAYQFIGQPERSVEWYRAELARGRDTHASTRACVVIGLAGMGSPDEALPATKGLIDAAEATGNPYAISFALLAYGTAFRDADPDRARAAMRRGVVIAQDSGNRFNESHLAATLGRLEAQHGAPLAALEYSAVAIRHLHDSGNSTTIRGPLATLAAFLHRLGRYEPAATIAGFASTPMTAIGFRELGTAITHLRDVLGDQTYESLARKGETGADAAISTNCRPAVVINATCSILNVSIRAASCESRL